MTTDREILANIAILESAIEADDDELGKKAVIYLLGGFLQDVHRIADALEHIAMKGIKTY